MKLENTQHVENVTGDSIEANSLQTSFCCGRKFRLALGALAIVVATIVVIAAGALIFPHLAQQKIIACTISLIFGAALILCKIGCSFKKTEHKIEEKGDVLVETELNKKSFSNELRDMDVKEEESEGEFEEDEVMKKILKIEQEYITSDLITNDLLKAILPSSNKRSSTDKRDNKNSLKNDLDFCITHISALVSIYKKIETDLLKNSSENQDAIDCFLNRITELEACQITLNAIVDKIEQKNEEKLSNVFKLVTIIFEFSKNKEYNSQIEYGTLLRLI